MGTTLPMDADKIYQAFRVYRTSAVAYSATIIVVSGAVVFSLRETSGVLAFCADILLGLSVIGALIIQFVNVRGLYFQAQALIQFNIARGHTASGTQPTEVPTDLKFIVEAIGPAVKKMVDEAKKRGVGSFQRSNEYFRHLDWLVPLSLILCVLGLLCYGILVLGAKLEP